jgi:hypothetical protein
MQLPLLSFITPFSNGVYSSKCRVLFIVKLQFRFLIQNRFLMHIIVIPAKVGSLLHVIPAKAGSILHVIPAEAGIQVLFNLISKLPDYT